MKSSRLVVIAILVLAGFFLFSTAWLKSAVKSFEQKTGRQKTQVEYLTSPERATAPFSEAVRVGNLLFLSGQLGRDPATGKLAEGGIEAETRQCLENIKKTLEKHGSSLDRVVKATVMLADIGEWAKMNSVYTAYFATNKPARSAFGVSGLAGGARVEIEVVAVLD
ncbi:MAG: Rid family detoxifying hydrolase [Candidatus Saccharicenans sp.]|nr:Rid family detoxifying hydrolase [Candidatus Saccharicenans sp.]MDI6850184.1 Rid family detoxifying hydrolase [Candidatus Saccharicenans sp.]